MIGAISGLRGPGARLLAVGIALWAASASFAQPVTLFRFDGVKAGDLLGFAVAGPGDLNGDGHDDIAVSARGFDIGGTTDAGAVFALSGVSGSTLYRLDWSGTSGVSWFGYSLAPAGLVDGDTRPDILVGEPYRTFDTVQSGAAFIYSGGSGSSLGQMQGLAQGDLFGFSLASGDAIGDARPEFLIGAPGVNAADQSGTRVDAGMARLTIGSGAAILEILGPVAGGQLGRSVAMADVNGDGKKDLVVGAPFSNVGAAQQAGSVYVLSYNGSSWVQLGTIQGNTNFQGVGWAVANAGDVNGDGREDILIGGPFPGAGAVASGSVFLLGLPAGGQWQILRRFDGERLGAQFGSAVAGPGDVDGDGVPDILIGAYADSPGGKTEAGSAYIFSGKTGTRLARIDGANQYDHFGFSVAGAGDVNADGRRDFIVGAPDTDPGGRASAGSAFVYSFHSLAPTVSITSPAPGAVVKGTTTVRATASDESGIKEVRFLVDGQLRFTDTQSPYEWAWNTLSPFVPDGSHTVAAVAVDLDGLTAQNQIQVTVDNSTFDDVPATSLFWTFIEKIAAAHITSGCSSLPPLYCPGDAVLRQEIAAFLCRAAGKSPLDNPTPTFADVPRTNPFFGYIERLADAASWGGTPPTVGCQVSPTRLFCRTAPVRRDQMAKFVLVAMGQQPAACTGFFSDVQSDNPFCGYIEKLRQLGVVTGCGAALYCPSRNVTREEMAVFLVKGFGL